MTSIQPAPKHKTFNYVIYSHKNQTKTIAAPKCYCGAQNLNFGWVQLPGVAPWEALIPGLHEYTWILEGYIYRWHLIMIVMPCQDEHTSIIMVL